MKRMFVNVRSFATLATMLAALAGLAASASAFPQQSGQEGGSGDANAETEFSVHWCVKNKSEFARDTGVDWQSQIVMDSSIKRDVVMFYQAGLGNFPFNGPQETLAPGYMDRHLSKVRQHVDGQIPNVNFDGLVVIDYETWNLSWDRTRDQFKRPFGTNRAAYEDAAKNFYLATLNEVKRLRPLAKVGFYGYPIKRYRQPGETPRNTIGYGDLSHRASQMNDSLNWLWQAEDIICPSVYSLRRTVRDRVTRGDSEHNTPEHERSYLLTNIMEALRVGGDKPVYPVMAVTYTGGNEPLNDLNTELQLQCAYEAGAEGLILWGAIGSRENYNATNDWTQRTFVPRVRDLYSRIRPAADGQPTRESSYRDFSEAYAAGDMAADLNQDGFVNGDDFDAFMTARNADQPVETRAGGGRGGSRNSGGGGGSDGSQPDGGGTNGVGGGGTSGGVTSVSGSDAGTGQVSGTKAIKRKRPSATVVVRKPAGPEAQSSAGSDD